MNQDIIVQCGHCGWQGRQSRLVKSVADYAHLEAVLLGREKPKYSCPYCHAEFRAITPAPPRK